MLEDSQSAGTKTIQILQNQGEDLNRVESGLASINADLKKAEKHLKKTVYIYVHIVDILKKV